RHGSAPVETVKPARPGSSRTGEGSAETATYYYALRVKSAYGIYSVDAGTYCSFYDAAIPYATSFEIDDELGAVSLLGKGWKRQANFNSYGAVDTVVRSGEYAYAVHNDSVSRLQIGAGLNVYAGVEYELSFYVCAHGKYVYGNRWQHALKKPLGLSINGKDTTVVVPSPYISETPDEDGRKPWIYPNKDITKHTYTFVPDENRQLEIVFQALSDDSYYIDDLSVSYKGAISVPAVLSGLALDETASDLADGRLVLKFTNPSETLSGQNLETLDGVVFEYSPYRGFRDELGRDVVYEGKLETTAVGAAATYAMQVPYGGFWYVRAYAYNGSGRSPYTATLAVGYAGAKAECRFEVRNGKGGAVEGAAIVLEPLFSAPVEVPDYTAATDAAGTGVVSQMYCGRYAVRVGDFWYDTLAWEVNVRKDTTVKAVLTDREFHRWPAALHNLRVTATDGAAVKVSLSWRNPDADADGLPLAGINGLEAEAIDGIAFYYSTDGSVYEELTTVTDGLTPGVEATCDLTFPKQGAFTLRAIARNRHNTAERYEAVELPLGYVGNGYAPVYVCLSGNESVADVRITLVAASGDTAFTATGGADGRVAFSGVLAGTYDLFATADYYDRLIKEKIEVSASGDRTLDGFVYTLAQPEITSLEVLGFNSVKWDWNVAADRHFSDGFESYTDFAISDIGHYKLGGHKSKGQFGGVTWENMFEDQAYIVFNPSAATPSLADDIYLGARSGSKMLCSFFTIRNDDWLAHKVDGGGTLKFWACGPQISGAAPERFVVLYSATDDNFANFIPLNDGAYIETEKDWKEYTFELPDNARYFAIHCVSDDASVFKIDDLSYTLNHGAVIARAKEFEVYVDGSKVATVPATTSSYTFDNLKDGPRTLGLKAVYENGTSEMVTRNVVMGRQIVNPISLAVNNVGRNFIFSYRMPSGATADYFQIFLDGRHIKNTLALIDTLPTMTMNAEHVAGVCAVYNNHFSDTVTIGFRSELANETLEEAGMALYPNPSSDGLFKLQSVRNGMATVFTADGRRLRTWTLTPGLVELNMAAYPQGVYHLAIQLDNGRRYAVKLIITR
ncbi:MAG: choice-of-anchor J domain-containing protein, partial [Bacteroidales bacterium]|nr:choice-of-anchor J domain-containing protein [Bacteroidales bacterium]